MHMIAANLIHSFIIQRPFDVEINLIGCHKVVIQRVKSNIEFEIIYYKICRFVQHGDLCFRNAFKSESINYKYFSIF